jgi:hypothetical protein
VSHEKSLDHDKLRAVLSDDRFEWRKHVLQRLAERGICQASVVEILLSGERIEDYPGDTPYPSALFFGWAAGKPLHAVAALDETNEWAYVITVYEPDLEHFEADYKTRRKGT